MHAPVQRLVSDDSARVDLALSGVRDRSGAYDGRWIPWTASMVPWNPAGNGDEGMTDGMLPATCVF